MKLIDIAHICNKYGFVLIDLTPKAMSIRHINTNLNKTIPLFDFNLTEPILRYTLEACQRLMNSSLK